MKKIIVLLIAIFILGCVSKKDNAAQMNPIAENYVKLVLELGLYDGDVVDAYYGPKEWKPAKENKQELFPAGSLI